MNYEDVQPGQRVRYHPIMGGPHDGQVYTVTHKNLLNGARPVAWLEGKSGCVSVHALSRFGFGPAKVDCSPQVCRGYHEVQRRGQGA